MVRFYLRFGAWDLNYATTWTSQQSNKKNSNYLPVSQLLAVRRGVESMMRAGSLECVRHDFCSCWAGCGPCSVDNASAATEVKCIEKCILTVVGIFNIEICYFRGLRRNSWRRNKVHDRSFRHVVSRFGMNLHIEAMPDAVQQNKHWLHWSRGWPYDPRSASCKGRRDR